MSCFKCKCIFFFFFFCVSFIEISKERKNSGLILSQYWYKIISCRPALCWQKKKSLVVKGACSPFPESKALFLFTKTMHACCSKIRADSLFVIHLKPISNFSFIHVSSVDQVFEHNTPYVFFPLSEKETAEDSSGPLQQNKHTKTKYEGISRKNLTY